MPKKKEPNKREMRTLRAQQAVFVLVGIIVILSMVISMVVK
jgi:hypothetical protein